MLLQTTLSERRIQQRTNEHGDSVNINSEVPLRQSSIKALKSTRHFRLGCFLGEDYVKLFFIQSDLQIHAIQTEHTYYFTSNV